MEELSRRKQKRHPHNLRMLNFKPTTQSSVFTRPQPTGSRNEPRPPSRQASERTPTTKPTDSRSDLRPTGSRTTELRPAPDPGSRHSFAITPVRQFVPLAPARATKDNIPFRLLQRKPSSQFTPILVHGRIYTRYRKLQAWQPLRERGTTLNNRLHNSRKSLHLREFIQSGGRYSPRSPPSRR